jgi:thiamine transport system permease protein
LAWWQGFWSIDAGTSRFIDPLLALQSSILFAFGTGLIAALITVSCAGVVLIYPRFTWLTLLLIAPLGLSAVTVGLALLTSYGSGGLGLATSVLIIVLSHSLIAVPLVLSAVLPSIRSLDSRLQMVAAGLGAKPWRSLFSAYGSALRRAGLVAGGLAAGVSFGEFGAASVVTRIDTATLPIMVVRLLSRPGEASLGLAAVAGVLLVLVVGTVVWLFDRWAKF